MNLVEKMRQSRQNSVKSGKVTFTVRRPTDLEMLELNKKGAIDHREILTQFTCGWSGVKEKDLFPGGSEDDAKFSAEVFAEFISDHPEHWRSITDAVLDGYKEHEKKVEGELKNSNPGSV